MNRLAALLTVVFCACASTPKPLSASATAAERLEAAERATTTLKNARVSFVSESKGALTVQLTGTLDLFSKNTIALSSEGQFGNDQVHLELDTKNGDQNRSLTRGASVSNHKEPVPDALSETLGVMLVRLGVSHALGNLSTDLPIDKANGGVGEWLTISELTDLGAEAVGDVPCHRLSFNLTLDGQALGTTNVCIADATALPLDHATRLKTPSGERVVTERYTWSFKDGQ
jgi:hypothetical protein